MTEESNSNPNDGAVESEVDRIAARTRNKKKQLMYRRHLARGSPSNAAMSPNGCSFSETPTQQDISQAETSSSSEPAVVEKMEQVAAPPRNVPTAEVVTAEDEKKEQPEAKVEPVSPSSPKTEVEPELEQPHPETSATAADELKEQSKAIVTTAADEKRERLRKFVEENQEDEEELVHEDPPLEDIRSEVSVATNAFDMRSIHDFPPSPPPEPEEKDDGKVTDPSWDPAKQVVFESETTKHTDAKEKDTLDIFETGSWAQSNTDFSATMPPSAYPDIDDLAQRLLAEQEREQQQERERQQIAETPVAPDFRPTSPGRGEEKKEKELSDPSDEAENAGTQDTAWDTFSNVFSESNVLASTNKEMATETVDMFDTSSWGNVDAAFSDVSLSRLAHHPDIETQFLRLMQEDMEKRQMDLNEEQIQVLEELTRNLAAAERLKKAGATEEPTSTQKEECEKLVEPLKDDEPLLIGKSSNSDEADNTDEDKISVEQRVEKYTAQVDDDSSTGDTKEPDDDDDESEDEGEEVEYVGQESDDEGDNVEESRDIASDVHQETVSAQDAPKFDVAAHAAEDSDSLPKVQVEGLDLVDGTASPEGDKPVTETSSFLNGSVISSVNSSLAGEHFLGSASQAGSTGTGVGSNLSKRNTSMPPKLPPAGALPPPPPPGEKKKRSKNKSGGNTDIPLLAPPPEEKLKKWEDDKMRGHKHLEAMKAKRDAVDVEGPPVVTRSVEPSLFSTPNKDKQSKSPSDKARSPSNVESILTDQAMAEKVALASSAAAVTFEECLIKGGTSPRSPASYGINDSNQNPIQSSMGFCSPDRVLDTTYELPIDTDTNQVVRTPEGGAFKNWKPSDFKREYLEEVKEEDILQTSPERKVNLEPPAAKILSSKDLLSWFSKDVLGDDLILSDSQKDISIVACLLLEDDTNFNKMCQYMADSVNKVTAELGTAASFEELTLATTDDTLKTSDRTSNGRIESYVEQKRPWLKPMVLSNESRKLVPSLLAANFVSFLYLASKLAKVPSPFGNKNPFLAEIVELSLKNRGNNAKRKVDGVFTSSPQQKIFDHPQGKSDGIVDFVYKVCQASEDQIKADEELNRDASLYSPDRSAPQNPLSPATPSAANTSRRAFTRRLVFPAGHPSPFESSVWTSPRMIAAVLSFLGDPVAACRMKMVNRFCCRIISENEHMIMQDAVRVGGLSMNVRPAFWMWITLQKSGQEGRAGGIDEFKELEKRGREGQWQHVIQRDVARSFGNMPPHKTGARLRTDSIVRALVTWGQNRIMKRGVKGGGDPMPTPELGPKEHRKQKDKPRKSSIRSPPWECAGDADSVASETPTDTVSDWGGVSPVGSFAGSNTGFMDGDSVGNAPSGRQNSFSTEELALSGNSLTLDMKTDLQNKLSFILHSLAATYEDVGYCQGMDYVVAHLLRILQDTIRWQAIKGTLPPAITTASTLPDISNLRQMPPGRICEEIDNSLIVEEAVFRVMDTFFTSYNLRHMYWPELRCLKTCCRVFERLIQIKLPVLADHFEHHDLNVGLFALGWFQTLFLYLPSMPSATVCHMWDIFLVERSFKIFFRVGTAILFLSQPILLNQELEGMMTYLNTIPDATLLKPDILIACALNIKVTNRMLQELEAEVTAEG
jgi:hypothetical protein